MKELSVKEKAKRYDDAVKKLKVLHDDWATTQNRAAKEIEELIPELAESEDERIRKEIISMSQTLGKTEWIAWLEKQERKPEIKVIIPKFRVGYIVKSKSQPMLRPRKIISIGKDCYWCEDKGCIGFACEDYYEIVEQKPAEWSSQQSKTLQTDDVPNDSSTAAPFRTGPIGFDGEPMESKPCEQKPAESIKEYDFHGIKFVPKFAKGDIIKDKKRGEISTIEGFSYDTGLYTHTYGQFPITIQDNYEIIAQKPAWSEEDESLCMQIKGLLKVCLVKNLLSFDLYKKMCDLLKSLKDRYTWKPSDEQMRELGIVATGKGWFSKEILSELLEQLKKLMEE